MFKYIDFNKSISTVNERPISVVIKRKKKHTIIYILKLILFVFYLNSYGMLLVHVHRGGKKINDKYDVKYFKRHPLSFS